MMSDVYNCQFFFVKFQYIINGMRIVYVQQSNTVCVSCFFVDLSFFVTRNYLYFTEIEFDKIDSIDHF